MTVAASVKRCVCGVAQRRFEQSRYIIIPYEDRKLYTSIVKLI